MPRHGQSNIGEYCNSFAHVSLVRVRGNESSDDACDCSPEMKSSETPRSGPIPFPVTLYSTLTSRSSRLGPRNRASGAFLPLRMPSACIPDRQAVWKKAVTIR